MKLLTIKSVLCAMTAGLLLSVVPLQAANMAASPGANGQVSNARGQGRKNWRKTHPWRTKDNRRIHNQEGALNRDLKSGKINQQQYNSQMSDLHNVQREENVDARANENGGHLSAGQQQAINSHPSRRKWENSSLRSSRSTSLRSDTGVYRERTSRCAIR
jgi:hypothetical protein